LTSYKESNIYSELSTLKNDIIVIKIPEDNKKIKAIIEMQNFNAWLDEFDILILIEMLFKGLNTEQQTNLLDMLRREIVN